MDAKNGKILIFPKISLEVSSMSILTYLSFCSSMKGLSDSPSGQISNDSSKDSFLGAGKLESWNAGK